MDNYYHEQNDIQPKENQGIGFKKQDLNSINKGD